MKVEKNLPSRARQFNKLKTRGVFRARWFFFILNSTFVSWGRDKREFDANIFDLYVKLQTTFLAMVLSQTRGEMRIRPAVSLFAGEFIMATILFESPAPTAFRRRQLGCFSSLAGAALCQYEQ
jgi:hypothetical protein